MGQLNMRRQVMMAGDNNKLVTVSSNTTSLNFSTELTKPLKSCIINFLPTQSGEGDPSPENERPIIHWLNNYNITLSSTSLPEQGNTYSITTLNNMGGGGYIDIAKGIQVILYHYWPIDRYYSISEISNNEIKYNLANTTPNGFIMCNYFKSGNTGEYQCYINNNGQTVFKVPSTIDTVQKWNNFVNQYRVVVITENSRPDLYTHTFTPTKITTLIGSNYIWCDTGSNISIKYWDKR